MRLCASIESAASVVLAVAVAVVVAMSLSLSLSEWRKVFELESTVCCRLFIRCFQKQVMALQCFNMNQVFEKRLL
jgi:hypothetical protein